MELASHNSWSYLKPRKWWMKLVKFTAKCQDYDIREQYEEYDIRCFDLRLKFDEGDLIVVHGAIEYSISYDDLFMDLNWLNSKKDVAVRILLDVRNKKDYTVKQVNSFKSHCAYFSKVFPDIKWWCGRNLYNWEVDYKFDYDPSCEEKYASVCSPKYIDDWYPRWFAKHNNSKILEEGTNKDYLMIDFVNYQ